MTIRQAQSAARGEPFDFAQDKLRQNSALRTIHAGGLLH